MTAPRHRDRSAGFVLINALVLVAALAGTTAWMLSLAQDTRVRAASGTEVAQLNLYLDAGEAFGMTVLAPIAVSGQPVHRGQAWAQSDFDVPLDRGRIRGQLDDLQGRFNLNWLADPSDLLAREAFARLAATKGLPPTRVDEIIAFLTPNGAGQDRAYASADPAIAPVGGALLIADQLRDVPSLSASEWTRLAPLVTALPGSTPLNVNTASAEVLAALLPGSNAAALASFVFAATQRPFQNVDDAMLALAKLAPDSTLADFDPGRLSVSSTWFTLRTRAQLDARQADRQSVLFVQPLLNPVTVTYRLDKWQ